MIAVMRLTGRCPAPPRGDEAEKSKRNLFIARFGDPASAKGLYVTMGEVYGAKGAAF